MPRRFKLADVASISAGQTFRGKSETDNAGSGVKLLQIKDIKEGVYAGAGLPWADIDQGKLSVQLEGGELLLPLRGNRSDVMLYERCEEWPVTTPNQVAIIRPVLRLIEPYFLLWFLNSNEGRAQLDSRRSGTTVGHISAKALSDIELVVPSLSDQHKVVRVYINWLEQRQVLNKMIDVAAELTEALCTEMVEGKEVRDE